MAKSPPEPEPPEPSAGGYFHWSRDPAVGLFAVLPLWVVYELSRLRLSPDERNGAEQWLLHAVHGLGGHVHLLLSAAFCALMVVAARRLIRNQVPWARVAAVIALEGTVYALLLGPIAAELTLSVARGLVAAPAPAGSLAANLVGSIGAGIFEELVFRLGLMSALVWIGLRTVRAWSLPRWLAGAVAVLVSALVFSWFHHLCGEPFQPTRFLFRTMAGVLLGLLMWARGYGVCVYTHSFYNLYFYLTADDR